VAGVTRMTAIFKICKKYNKKIILKVFYYIIIIFLLKKWFFAVIRATPAT